MTIRTIEFKIDEVLDSSELTQLVFGKAEYGMLRVGDEFTKLFRLSRSGDVSQYEGQDVSLRIEAIDQEGVPLAEVDMQIEVYVTLSGPQMGQLRAGDMLATPQT